MRRPFILLALALLSVSDARADSGWRYVVPGPDDAFAHPPPRALALTSQKPADLKESVTYQGNRRHYAQLIYGSGRPGTVAVVVDEGAAGKLELYVDADRDWTITAKDKVAGENLTWRTPLKALVPEGDSLKEFPRTVLMRYGRVSRTLSIATCGFLEGRLRMDGRDVAVRRVDGDANGLLADAQDRVWLDRNGDGVWAAADEEFLFAPILRLGDRRFALRADVFGERLDLVPLEGTGKVRLVLPSAVKPDHVEEILMTVQSRDGVVASLRGTTAEATVPTGEYRVSSVLLTLKDSNGGPAWGYVFGDNGGKGHKWRRLDRDATLTLDPVGALDFSASVGEGKKECRAGDSLSVRPALYTGDGLLIEKAYRGGSLSAFDGGCSGRIALVTADGHVLEAASSGFA